MIQAGRRSMRSPEGSISEILRYINSCVESGENDSHFELCVMTDSWGTTFLWGQNNLPYPKFVSVHGMGRSIPIVSNVICKRL